MLLLAKTKIKKKDLHSRLTEQIYESWILFWQTNLLSYLWWLSNSACIKVECHLKEMGEKKNKMGIRKEDDLEN